MKINPLAIVFWIFLALVGFLINGGTGAAVGALIGIAASAIIDLFV